MRWIPTTEQFGFPGLRNQKRELGAYQWTIHLKHRHRALWVSIRPGFAAATRQPSDDLR